MTALFTAFIIKHFICDFLLQKPRHYLNKGKYGNWGGIEHALIHGMWTVIICGYFSLPLWAAVADTVIHYHIDWLKMNLNERWNLKPDNSEYFWWLLGADQMAHYLTYVGIIAIWAQ